MSSKITRKVLNHKIIELQQQNEELTQRLSEHESFSNELTAKYEQLEQDIQANTEEH